MNCNPPGSSVHGVLLAKILEWVTVPCSRDLPDPDIKPASFALLEDSLWSEPPGNSYIYMIPNIIPNLMINAFKSEEAFHKGTSPVQRGKGLHCVEK